MLTNLLKAAERKAQWRKEAELSINMRELQVQTGSDWMQSSDVMEKNYLLWEMSECCLIGEVGELCCVCSTRSWRKRSWLRKGSELMHHSGRKASLLLSLQRSMIQYRVTLASAAHKLVKVRGKAPSYIICVPESIFVENKIRLVCMDANTRWWKLKHGWFGAKDVCIWQQL